MMFFTSQTLPDPAAAAAALAADFARWAAATPGALNVAFSGGRTAELLFAELAGAKHQTLPWARLGIFWADERWVPYESLDSNFGNAWRALLGRPGRSAAALHPMLGLALPGSPAAIPHPAARIEAAAWSEALASAADYSRLLLAELPHPADGIPIFDLVLLGMGADGHTASLFPEGELATPAAPCSATRHPATGAMRLTLTPAVLNHARQVVFLVTGADKAAALQAVANRADLPAANIAPISSPAAWYLDAAAKGQRF